MSTQDISKTIEAARELEISGSFQAAFNTYRSVLERFPKRFPALMGAGRTARILGHSADCLEYFRRAAEFHPDRPEPIIQIGQQQAKDNLVEAARTYFMGASRFPENELLRSLDAEARVYLNDEDDLSRHFDIDAELQKGEYQERVYLSILNSRKAILSKEDISRYYGCLAEVFPHDPSSLRYADALMAARKYNEAFQVFEHVSNDATSGALMGKAICKGALGEFEASRAFLERYMNRDVTAHKILQTCVTFLGASPDLDRATDIVDDLNRTSGDPGLENLIAFSRSILPPKRALLDGDIRDHNFRMSTAGETRAVVLAFAGFALQTGMLPFSLIDRFFAGHSVAVGSLVDARGCIFWKGIPALGEDLGATVSALKAELAAMNLDRIYTLGNSGGGTAAMVYGCALGARRALSFSGPTDLRKSFLARIGDTRGQAVIHGLNKRLTDSELNLRGWLEDREYRCSIHAYYCESEKNDAAHAANISHIQEVSLRPIGRYSEHECIGSALGTGDLLREFNSILENIRLG